MKNNKDKNSPLKRVPLSLLPVDLSPQIEQAEEYAALFGTEQAVSPAKTSGGFDMTSAGGMGIISGIGNIASGLIGRGDRRDAQIAAQNEYTTMLSKYRNLDTRNLYANVQNQYEGLENTFEDLTVNQQQAQFEAQQGQQQRANIMQNLRGAAGSSGIAGLAQALANQGQLQTQRISASIGAQEAQNQKLAAQGAHQADLAERKGEQLRQQFEMDKQATLLGVQMGTTAGVNAAAQAAALNQQQVTAAGNTAIAGAMGDLAGSLITSDYSSLSRTTDPNSNIIDQKPWEAEGITENQWHLNQVDPKNRQN